MTLAMGNKNVVVGLLAVMLYLSTLPSVSLWESRERPARSCAQRHPGWR
jgi:hypothetical protein